MASADTRSVIERAKWIYAEQPRAVLEREHLNRFVAIEPGSGEYFPGDTFDEAGERKKGRAHLHGLIATINVLVPET